MPARRSGDKGRKLRMRVGRVFTFSTTAPFLCMLARATSVRGATRSKIRGANDLFDIRVCYCRCLNLVHALSHFVSSIVPPLGICNSAGSCVRGLRYPSLPVEMEHEFGCTCSRFGHATQRRFAGAAAKPDICRTVVALGSDQSRWLRAVAGNMIILNA